MSELTARLGVKLVVWPIVLGGVGVSPAAALQARAVLRPIPRTTTAQAISYLNEQRAANGIPGNLANEPALSRGCWLHTNKYKEKPGQLPHMEIRGQPGYTPLGNQAAQVSDLGGGPGDWSSTINPWTDAPFHLEPLFDPAATNAWYGETHGKWGFGQACMGTGGHIDTLTGFYSYPGNGATEVEYSELAGEENSQGKGETPGSDVGIPLGTTTGPYIILYSEEPSISVLRGATLHGPTGQSIAVKVYENFVIVVKPLQPTTDYTLTATWSDHFGGSQQTQTVQFRTMSKHDAAVKASGDYQCSGCPHGSVRFRTHAGKITVTVSPAVGQRIRIALPIGRRTCVLPQFHPCPRNAIRYEFVAPNTTVVRHYRRAVTIPLPSRTSSDPVVGISVVVDSFVARGYQWDSSVLSGPVPAPLL